MSPCLLSLLSEPATAHGPQSLPDQPGYEKFLPVLTLWPPTKLFCNEEHSPGLSSGG